MKQGKKIVKDVNDVKDEICSPLRCNYNYQSRLSLRTLTILPNAISPDRTEWLHCVEATKEKIKGNQYLIRLRVIINGYRGVTITVSACTQEMVQKYIDLRFQIRNSDRVLITFPELYVTTSLYVRRELYLCANDFKVYGSDDGAEPEDNPFPEIFI